jgi:hypothetical protein
VFAVAEDHVVEDAYAEELSDVTQALRELDILSARFGIPTRVIVSEQQRRGATGG